MTNQPKALLHAARLESEGDIQAAAEMRRLQAVNKELLDALKDARTQLEDYEVELNGDSYNDLKINAAIDNALAEQPAQQQYTYASTQATMCAGCGEHKHTPLRIDAMGGYVCLTCIDKKLGSLLGEFGYPQPAQQEPVAWRYTTSRGTYRYCKHRPSIDMAAEYAILEPIPLYTSPQPSKPEQQEPVAWHDKIKGMEVSMDVSTGEDDAHNRIYGRVYEVILEDGEGTPNAILAIEEDRNFTSPPPAQRSSKPDFKAFLEWAKEAGYDTAYTHDGINWHCLNPMTADLWRAWQAALNCKEGLCSPSVGVKN